MNLSYKHRFNKCNKYFVSITTISLFCIAYLIYNQPMVEGFSKTKTKTKKDIEQLKEDVKDIYINQYQLLEI